MIVVEPGDPGTPQVLELLRASHTLMTDLFDPEENHFLSIDQLRGADVRFFTARTGETVAGCGALAIRDGYGEVKSMFTAPAARGAGVAAALLRQIEDEARGEALKYLRLETGDKLDAARRLYSAHGFAECGPFGPYTATASSVFMEKLLT